ncbi:MAG: metallophosphoesterase [Kiritimatiellae bacterium]|nr:metallophosphoesterase [Kiritimatiellia bacterium]
MKHGEPAKGNVLFYEWSGYPKLLTRVVRWLLNRRRPRRQTINSSILHIMAAMALLALQARADVSLVQEDRDGVPCYRLDNGRVSLVVNASRGAAVVSYKDRLGGDVDLISDIPPCGLCHDRFRSQGWPGEMFDAEYEVTERKADPQAGALTLRCRVTGQWGGREDEKLKDLVLEKTYTLRADSPALECRLKFTAPPQEAKSFAYWQQHIVIAGGQYDQVRDKSFRPSKRGVRVAGRTGQENFLPDITAGWMALLDTKRQTGLVILSEYDKLDNLYACGGNTTLEPTYQSIELPAGQAVEYITYIIPVVGLDNVVSATPDYIAGYHLKTDGTGTGTLAFSAIRSVHAPAALSMNVTLTNAQKPAQTASVGGYSFEGLGDRVQTKEGVFTNAGEGRLVVKVVTEAKDAAGIAVAGAFEERFDSRAVLAAAGDPEPPDFVPGSWTLVLLPDTQNYSEQYPGMFAAQTSWIVQNKDRYDIRYVLHMGDLVNCGAEREWRHAQEAMSLLDGKVPYAIAYGNHDSTSYKDMVAGKSLLSRYFPVAKFASWPTFGGVMDGDTANSYHLFSAGGSDWIVLALEWAPRNKTVQWAHDVLAKYPDRKAILVTHAYLHIDNTRYDFAKKGASQAFDPHTLSPDREGDVNDGE